MFETSPLPSESATKHAARLNPAGSLPTQAAPILKRRTKESERERHEANEPRWADGRRLRARLFAAAVAALKTRFGLTVYGKSKSYTEAVKCELGRTDKSAGRVLSVSGSFCPDYYIVPAFGGYELWEAQTLNSSNPDKAPIRSARSTATTDARATLLAQVAELEAAKTTPPEPTPPLTAAESEPETPTFRVGDIVRFNKEYRYYGPTDYKGQTARVAFVNVGGEPDLYGLRFGPDHGGAGPSDEYDATWNAYACTLERVIDAPAAPKEPETPTFRVGDIVRFNKEFRYYGPTDYKGQTARVAFVNVRGEPDLYGLRFGPDHGGAGPSDEYGSTWNAYACTLERVIDAPAVEIPKPETFPTAVDIAAARAFGLDPNTGPGLYEYDSRADIFADCVQTADAKEYGKFAVGDAIKCCGDTGRIVIIGSPWCVGDDSTRCIIAKNPSGGFWYMYTNLADKAAPSGA